MPFPADLIRKYNQPGPRYTSYPTALQFAPVADPAALLADTQGGAGPLSLYYHLPFCESLCWFCACTTVITTNRGRADGYIDLLEREMDLFLPHLAPGRPVEQLHWGGGSPSFFTAAQIARLGRAIRERFSFTPDAECSVELDPRTLRADKVEALAAAGFNRASFGVQDVNPEVQEAVHRIQPSALNRQCLDWIRAAGFGSVNIDLIYGLPKQTVASFRATLEEVLDYRPERLAIFSYAHVPWVAPAQKILERSALPDADTKLQMLEMIIATLAAAGYVHIGMDHFALPDDELAVAQRSGAMHRNFQGYSTRAGSELCAFGMSAISQSRATYRQNFKELPDYEAALQAGRLPIERGLHLPAEDLRRRTVIMRLMCDLGLDYAAMGRELGLDFATHFAAELASLEEKERDGLVVREPGHLRVTESGKLLIRTIAMHFDTHLQQGPKRHAKTI